MRQPGDDIAISIIVPVYLQWTMVPDLIAAIAANDLESHRAELVLVDDEQGAGRELPLPAWARIVPGPGRGSYAARNAGAAAARGDWLVFTDADCRPRPNWLAELSAAAAARPDALLAGPIAMQGTAGPNRWEIFDIVRGIPQARYVAHGYAATANLVVPASVFRRLGGFDDTRRSGGDAAFCRRAARHGVALHLVPQAVTEHLARDSWTSLAAKARRVKGGQAASGSARHRALWTIRTLGPPLREIALYLVSDHPPRHRLIAATVRLQLWGVELAEMARLLTGGRPRR